MSLARDIQQQYQNGERQFSEQDLARQNFSYQTLDGCDFSMADLSHTNLSAVSFKSVNFQNADLSYSICTNSNFSEANLSGAILTAANLSNARFLGAVYDDRTQFPEGFEPESAGAIYCNETADIESTAVQDLLVSETAQSKTEIQDFEIQSTEISEFKEKQTTTIQPVETVSDTFNSLSDKLPEERKPATVPLPDPLETGDQTFIQTPNPIKNEVSETINKTKDGEALSSSSTLLASPANTTPPGKRKKSKKTIWLFLLALSMPAMGALAFLSYNTHQSYQNQRSILATIKEHQKNKDYESCLKDISDAESQSLKPAPFLDFPDQLDLLKNSCEESFASQNLNKGMQFKNSQQYREAIATLSKIPQSAENYPTAQDLIQATGELYCDDLELEAKDSGEEDQFRNLISEGKDFPTQEAIADECQQRMSTLQNKWEENIPVLMEAETLLAEGDCQRGKTISDSLGESVFQKWKNTAKKLARDATACKTPIEVSTTLQSNSVHKFKGVAGQNIKIDLRSSDFDPVVTLLDATGNEIDTDDDTGTGNNALLKQQLKRSGEFQIRVSAYKRGSGTYSLKVTR